MITEILLFIITVVLSIFLATVIFTLKKFYKIIVNFLPPSVVSSNSIPTSAGEKKTFLSSWKYKLMLVKAYFENGYSLLSYPKWVLAVFGVGEIIKLNYWYVIIGAFAFGIFCIFVGYFFIQIGFYEAQQEVSNQFNLFVKEVRERKTL